MPACNTCSCREPLGFGVKMAFQPIVDIANREVFAYESLVRGENGEGAGDVLARVNDDNKYTFDQTCRIRSIETAAKLNLQQNLSINFMPNAIYEPETCLAQTLKTANETGFPREKIIFEVTEHEKIENHNLLVDVFKTYREYGFRTAIDDFGEGYAGLNLLADFQPDFLKIDMNLIRNIHLDRTKKAILSGIISVATELEIQLIAEGIETDDEYKYLRDRGINLMQGYFFCRPAIEQLNQPNWPE
ncbi:EAL domain, c-di-GMP-specific phosphodiesterase class I (or its enzymatically inactive variant) [Pseudidiomarina planktonica]|uniref:EAL domain, c-di-GMP-specific phosphodiesterase class I (Or its enzymatically inactive variant) n=1 Tax=Pseudidiomarina planktonica TaxID=1323738 RepID=A0A1Y6EF83_9GAMM|nr:EAL domain-containing protein [Pseudidiomarina planktonica]RUO65995.1 EAL domain-containing protein [Pseudidiomarina planktonica]SMQ61235.1 EAL domain, c-di-GMP-specific phosphodiesterase class I (or its enzymatically inactive variant) [Pseudidiomarina planktonica]